jgi:hypothetical protein
MLQLSPTIVSDSCKYLGFMYDKEGRPKENLYQFGKQVCLLNKNDESHPYSWFAGTRSIPKLSLMRMISYILSTANSERADLHRLRDDNIVLTERIAELEAALAKAQKTKKEAVSAAV